MICPVCGAENEATAVYCYHCGSSLKSAASTGPTVNLGQSATSLHNTDPLERIEPEHNAKVYDVPAAPASAQAYTPDTAWGERTSTPVQTPYVPSYTMPAQSNVPSYTPPYTAATYPQQSNTALIAMLLGIGSFVLYALLFCFVFLSPLSVVLGIPAIVLGRNARREIRASGGQIGGDGMALAGVILGWINIALSVLTLCGIIAFFAAVAG